ncbi:MAG TPA: gliding motility-associated C-terminal domain-containing protein, partial [Segetibacter sp.]
GIKPLFTASSVFGGANPTYQWKINDKNAGAANNSSTFSPSGLNAGDVVSCELTNNDKDCLTTSSASSNSITVINTPTDIPAVLISASDTIICTGSPITFSATPVKGGSTPVYQWKVNGINSGTNNSVFVSNTFKNGDVVTCSITSNLTCVLPEPVSSKRIILTVDTPAVIHIRPDTTIFSGSSIRLNTTTSGTVASYQWSPSATLNNFTVASPVATPTTTTTYKVTAVTPGECRTTAEVTISTITEIKITNAFSPNGDGINDVWNIPGLSFYANCTVQIFNRYGQVVFQSTGYDKPWEGTSNGKQVPIGTYYYIINTDQANGKMSGSITVLR